MGLVKFGDLVKEVKINIDRNNNPYDYYVGGDHMDSEDLTIRRKGSFATDDVGPAFTRLFKPGQILYGSRRTYLKKVAVADFEGICSNTTFVLETKNESKLRQRLLPFIMLTDDFTKWSVSKSKGSTNPYILFSDLANYEFDLPDISRQDELVKLLWQAYETKESYKEMIRATDEMVKSQFIEMIGRVDSTPFNTCLIGEIATIKHGYPFDGHYFSEEDNGVMLVTPGNFKIGGGFQEIKCKYFTSSYPTEYVLNSGDLIVTMTDLSKQSDTLGFGAIVPTREGRVYLHNQRIGLFENVSPLVDKEYLCWCLRTSEYRSYILSSATGSIIKHTSPKRIQEARIIMPPLTIQKQFVSISRQADKSKYLS